MAKWKVEYCNDVTGDDRFSEWWEVTDGDKTYKADCEEDAAWLRELLNKHA